MPCLLVAHENAVHGPRAPRPRRSSGGVRMGTSVIAGTVGCLALGIAAEALTGAGQSLAVALGDLIAGEAIGLAGLVCVAVSPRRPTGPLLVLASALWFAATLAASENRAIASFGSVVGLAYRGALVSAVLLALCRPKAAITVAVACFAWADALISPVGASTTAAVLLGAVVLLAVAIAPRGTRSWTPALLLALALAGPAVAVTLGETVDSGNRVLLAADLATGLAAVTATARIVADQRLEDRLADRIVDLAAVTGLGGALATALRDPRVRLLSPNEPGPLRQDRQRTLIMPAAGGGMIVEHPVGALDAAAVRLGVTNAIGLQLAHDQRTAELAGATAELRRAQRRIVLAADAARARLQRRLERDAISRAEALRDRLAEEKATAPASDQLSETVVQLRKLASGLHPAAVRSGGIGLALVGLARASAPAVSIDAPPTRYPDEVELVAYYACAEAIANAIKHAQASHVSVVVREVSGTLTATVRDDGVGGADANGRGLSGLAARANAIGGTVHVTTRTGGGTAVVVSLPV
jgi:signal transduction histidine kinase